MFSPTLEQVWERVQALSTDEQQQLRDRLDVFLKTKPAMTEDEFEQHLLKLGIISRIPSRIRDAAADQNRVIVDPKGKLASEIIIKERR